MLLSKKVPLFINESNIKKKTNEHKKGYWNM